MFTCPECGGPTWRERCGNSRCIVNSQRHLRRQLERVRCNLRAFRGDTFMVTLTAPGRDVLPMEGSMVNWTYAAAWNQAVWGHWKKLRHSCSVAAERGEKGVRRGECMLAVVPEFQRRGVVHLHVVLGAQTFAQRRWCERFGRHARKEVKRKGSLWGHQIRVSRVFGGGAGAARYLASYVGKGGEELRIAWEDGTLPARCFYVSRRLTRETGVTIRMLRRRSSAFRWGLSIPVAKLAEWVEYEREFGRELSFLELACLARPPSIPPV